MSPETVFNAFSVDVEDYFQVSAFKDRVSTSSWDKYECRVEENTDRILRLLDKNEVRATFFVLGWVADRYKDLVKRIQYAGHEIGSHGYWHQLIYSQTPEQFSIDIQKSKDALTSITGEAVTAYRAPSFSIVERSLWALDILIEQGFETDSSIFPISGHDLYGMPGAKGKFTSCKLRQVKLRNFHQRLGTLESSTCRSVEDIFGCCRFH